MAKVRKITDKEFWAILRENAGIFARTAKAIKKKFDVEYSRQAVKQRAEKRPEILEDIEAENLDVAEDGLHTLLRSKDERVRQKAVEFYLKTKGKKRGYVERKEVDDGTGGKTFYDLLAESSTDESGTSEKAD
ncbi:hypothetical protein Q4E40_02655 [Pontibacter sp. BT731]|uniref:hypothetical protein n=1 Tax=Pontibacter coccineus TaxID=3063328 RepID=UPI0026E124D6|nr:hypothetical protein [Pontibacter sp. BT731]MDO6389013.1 hypothetical protein [Pontibacter sp. BT731]